MPNQGKLLQMASVLQANLNIKPRFHRMKRRKCFVGTDAVNYLVRAQFARTAEQAVGLMEVLRETGLIAHVDGSKKAFQNRGMHYRFTDAFLRAQASADASARKATKAHEQSHVWDGIGSSAGPATGTRAKKLFVLAAVFAVLAVLGGTIPWGGVFGYWLAKMLYLEEQEARTGSMIVALGLAAYLLFEAATQRAKDKSSSEREKRPRGWATDIAKAAAGEAMGAGQTLCDFLESWDIGLDMARQLEGPLCVSSMLNPAQPMVYCNDAFLQLTGYSREEVIGANCKILQGQDTNLRDVDAIRDIIRKKKDGFVQVLNYTKDGTPFTNMLYLRPLKNRSGKLIAYLGCQSRPGDDAPEQERDMNSEEAWLSPNLQCTVEGSNAAPEKLGKLIPFESDLFKGILHVRIKRTPPARSDPYFSDKRRWFELRVQGKFKRPVPANSRVWFGGEVPAPMKLSRLKKTTASLMLRFIAAFGKGLHHSFGDKPDMPSFEGADSLTKTISGSTLESATEKPHLCFPVCAAMDRVIVTPPGQVPPRVDDPNPLPKTKEFKELNKGKSMGTDFKVGNTYTMAVWSMYANFDEWVMCNIPGLGKQSLQKFWQDMPVQLSFYALDKNEATHSPAKRDNIAVFTIQHASLPGFIPWKDLKERSAKQAQAEKAGAAEKKQTNSDDQQKKKKV